MFNTSQSYVNYRNHQESADKRAQQLAEAKAEAEAMSQEVLILGKVITVETAQKEVERISYLMSEIISYIDQSNFINNEDLQIMMKAYDNLRSNRNYISDRVSAQADSNLSHIFYTI